MPYEFMDYSERLLRNALSRQAALNAVTALQIPEGAVVLDVGCGAGAYFGVLLDAVGETGQVVGIDLTPGHLDAARLQAARSEYAGRVVVQEVDIREPLPFESGSFDAVWVSNVISPKTVASPPAFVRELTRLLRPAGVLGIFETYGVRPTFLPGHPRLEHLIGVARSLRRSAIDEDWQPTWHPECSRSWLLESGLEAVQLDVELIVHQSPLESDMYGQIRDEVLGGYYGEAVQQYGMAAGMTKDDLALWSRLSDPESPDFVLRQSGYYCMTHALLARGVKAG